ncbi:MAG: MBL fold metallo-hydrolase [Thermoanaerobaculia bacterium]
MSGPSLYERVLERIAAGEVELPAPPQPRPSAGVVPWRRGAAGAVEVYWIRRARTMSFMGGWHAFPGGGVSKRDLGATIDGAPSGVSDAPAGAALPECVLAGVEELGPILVPGLVTAALRELFEEIGILPGAGPGGGEVEAVRRAIAARETSFEDGIRTLGLVPSADSLVYAGRWLTPPLGPLRFDNRFFLLEWPPQRAAQPAVDGREAEEGEWIRPAEGVERWERGEVIAAPPILHILRVLAEDGPEAGLRRLREPVEANLGPHRTIEFRPGVLLFPQPTPTLPPAAFTNAYLLGTGAAVLVDPGSPDAGEADRLAEALAAAEERLGRRTTAIWLTHHHPDHVGGAARLRERLGVPVLAHSETARLLAGRVPVDGELAEGDERDLGRDGTPFPVRLHHIPGHAPGHLAFLDETFGSMLCGDLVSGISMIVVDPPLGNMDDYLASLARVRELAPRTLFPGHGPTLADPAAKLDETIDHRRWREERILEAWRSGLREPADMLETVYDDTPRIAWPLAERQARAHLERLERAGRLG